MNWLCNNLQTGTRNLRVLVEGLAESLNEGVIATPEGKKDLNRTGDVHAKLSDILDELLLVERMVSVLPIAELVRLVEVVNRCRAQKDGVMLDTYNNNWDPKFVHDVTEAARAVVVKIDPPREMTEAELNPNRIVRETLGETARVVFEPTPPLETPSAQAELHPDPFLPLARKALGVDGFGQSFRDSGL